MSGSNEVPSTPSPVPSTTIAAKTAFTAGKDATSPGKSLPEPVPAKSREPWNAETWSLVITAVCTLLTLIVALLLGLHGMRTAELTVEALSENVKQGNLLGIYALSLESSKFFDANPKLVKFFDKSQRRQGMTDKELQEEFDKLDETQQTLARMACDKNADLMQVTFLQRMRLPELDWNNWWNGFCDQYDESPLLRDFLTRRHKWYAFVDAIKPEARSKYYRGTPRE